VPSSAAGIHVPPERRDIAMVFQSYAIWPHMSVAENAGFALRYGRRELRAGRAGRNAVVGEVLDRFGLAQYAAELPQVLSGGQEQRLALARAFLTRPAVLLLDEPLSNLDARLRVDMRRQLSEFHRDTRMTIVYITHDRGEALSLSDRIAVLSPRGLEQVGTPREVYGRPATEFVAKFVGNANVVPGIVAETAGEAAVIDSGPATVRVSQAAGLRKGDRVRWSINPEQVLVGSCTAAGDAPNELTGEVKHVDFMGDRCELVVALGDIDVAAYGDAALAAEPGTMVRLQLPPDRIGVFAEPVDDRAAAPVLPLSGRRPWPRSCRGVQGGPGDKQDCRARRVHTRTICRL
jgi:ABC-type Fe3+/spermidine/putrescine transport system ATPase subunit